ncbi:MAG: mycoredoxin [Pseudonocardia sp.]
MTLSATGKHGGPGAVDPDMVTMYSTTWCGYCRRLKIQMDGAGIEYRETDVDRDDAAAAHVVRINGGNRTVPTLVFPDGSTLTNPTLAQVQNRLNAPAA